MEPRVHQIGDESARTSRYKYHDATMSPLLGSEKPSAVRVVIGHIYYILSSGAIHSYVANMQR